MPLYGSSQSRFIWSAAFDFAKLLQVVGVDCVVSVDLQRPGQGHEACFFDNLIPVESLYSGDLMAKHFVRYIKEQKSGENLSAMNKSPPIQTSSGNMSKLVCVSATSKCVRKTRRFQNLFTKEFNLPVGFAVFTQPHHSSSIQSSDKKQNSGLLGEVKDADVVIVDECVSTGGRLAQLCRVLKKEGAKRIFVCASHGVFSEGTVEMIDLSPVELVLVTDSMPLPSNASKKIVQIPMAEPLAKIIESNVLHDDEVISVNSSADQSASEEIATLINNSDEDLVLD